MPTAVMIEFDREDQVEQEYLEDRAAEAYVDGLADDVVLVVGRIDGVVDLLGRLPDQEQAAGDQDQVAKREAVAEGREQRCGHADDPGDRREKQQPHDEGGADAEATGPHAVLGRQLVRQDRDEDQVIDAEHDLHGDQRDHGCPSFRGGQECETQVRHGLSPSKKQ